GLEEPSSGSVEVDGKPVTGPGPDRGMVFQSYTLFPWLTVMENVLFGPRMKQSHRGGILGETFKVLGAIQHVLVVILRAVNLVLAFLLGWLFGLPLGWGLLGLVLGLVHRFLGLVPYSWLPDLVYVALVWFLGLLFVWVMDRILASEFSRLVFRWLYGREAEKEAHEAEKDAVEWVKRVGLEHARDLYPDQLSGGMKQRVAAARGRGTKPRVWPRDEPFGALDAQTRARMQIDLKDIWRNMDITIVFITHDLDEAVFMADRIVVLSQQGRIAKIIEVPLEQP